MSKELEKMTYHEIIKELTEVKDEIIHDALEDELFGRLDTFKEVVHEPYQAPHSRILYLEKNRK